MSTGVGTSSRYKRQAKEIPTFRLTNEAKPLKELLKRLVE
jgi:hypothetical protein